MPHKDVNIFKQVLLLHNTIQNCPLNKNFISRRYVMIEVARRSNYLRYLRLYGFYMPGCANWFNRESELSVFHGKENSMFRINV